MSDPQTLWLNLTNIGLGVITLASVLVAAGGVTRELMIRRLRMHEAGRLDDEMHTLLVPELGLTMADGGQPVRDDKRK